VELRRKQQQHKATVVVKPVSTTRKHTRYSPRGDMYNSRIQQDEESDATTEVNHSRASVH
jgi:hypothetical protein